METLKLRYKSWKGDRLPPVPGRTLVSVIFRDGTFSTDVAGMFRWVWLSAHCGDIVAYRVIHVFNVKRKDT